ncbi:MAG: PAS domain S-box protein [Deltaproteobacteria bacterium]|nr:PAS domain S-box protein [Deltaproteobacteria bacterium]
MRFHGLKKILSEHFAARVFVLFLILLFIITLSFTAFFVRSQGRSMEDALLTNGKLLLKLLTYDSRIGVYSENEGLLKDSVGRIIQQEEVLEVSLFNQDGKLLIDAGKSETALTDESDKENAKKIKEITDNISIKTAPLIRDYGERLEFWSPVVSESVYTTDDSLFFGNGDADVKEQLIGFARITVDKRPLSVRVKGLLIKSFLMALVISLLGSIFLYMLIKRITGPLNRLNEGVRKIGRGETVERLPEETSDEIGKLAVAFNYMSESLRNREAALRESEEKYRQLFELESDAILLIEDATGRILEVNLTASRMYGYSREELLGMNERDLSAARGKEEHYSPGSSISAVAYHHRKKDGTVFPVETSVTRLSWKGRDVRISAVRDVTYRIRAEEEKARLEDKLRQAQKMEAIGTLAGGIAHDFNNVLGIIVVNTELAMNDVPGESQVQENLEEIIKACLRARDMVRQILAFSRKDEARTQPVMVTPLIKESIKLFRTSMLDNIEIIQDIRSESDIVMADPTQIHQVLMNLYNNAAYVLRETGGKIIVTTDNVELYKEGTAEYPDLNPGRYLRLSIRDTGKGIQPDILDRIFDPYFTTKKVGEGTGMGLAIAHGIVKSHGGAISVESEPGKGTLFHVLFPVIEADIRIEDNYEIFCPTGTESILFVDDEKPISDAMNKTLSRLGYRVTSRTDSTQALKLFSENPGSFDLLITDLVMPHMTGLELSKEVSSIRPDIPIILCTGYSEMLDDEIINQAGIRYRTTKPLVISEMANIIRETLDNIRKQ